MPFPLFPPALILVNNDLSPNTKNYMVNQLRIDQVLDGYTFDSIVYNDGYTSSAALVEPDKRIMVLRDLSEMNNRDFFDVVCFVKAGMITVLQGGVGPGKQIFSLLNLSWGDLGIF